MIRLPHTPENSRLSVKPKLYDILDVENSKHHRSYPANLYHFDTIAWWRSSWYTLEPWLCREHVVFNNDVAMKIIRHTWAFLLLEVRRQEHKASGVFNKEGSYVHQIKESNFVFNVCVRVFSRPTPPKSWGAFTKTLHGSLWRTKEGGWK